MSNRQTISISLTTLLAIAGIWLGLQFLFAVREVLLLFFVVLVLVAAFSPIVSAWSKRMPRVIAVVLLYLVISIIFAAIISLLVPPLVSQLISLADKLPQYLGNIVPTYFSYNELVNISKNSIEKIAQGLSSFGGGLFATTVGLFGSITAVLSVLVLTFYLLLEEHGVKEFWYSLLPISQKEEVAKITQKIGEKLGRWLNGQLLLMLSIAILDFIGFMVISIWKPELRGYALVLGVWAGLTEVIPYVGPWLGAIPAVLVGFILSPWVGVAIFIYMVLIQQVEGQFLVPRIMSKAVGLSPVIVIFALLIGNKLLGIAGVVLAVPFAAVLSVIYSEWESIRRIASHQPRIANKEK